MLSSKFGRSAFKDFPTTYPQPLGACRSLIEKSDIVKTFDVDQGLLQLVLARPEHSPILQRTVRDMYANEVMNNAAGTTEIPNDALETMVYNCVRYPLSFFAINEREEVVSIACANVRYRDNNHYPVPRKSMIFADRSHLFQAHADLMAMAEFRNFNRLEVDRLVSNEMAFTPTTVRGRGISSRIYPTVIKWVIDMSTKMGIRYNVGRVTSLANLNNMIKLGYRAADTLPREIYKKLDGTPMDLPSDENTAVLIEMDMHEVKNTAYYDRLE